MSHMCLSMVSQACQSPAVVIFFSSCWKEAKSCEGNHQREILIRDNKNCRKTHTLERLTWKQQEHQLKATTTSQYTDAKCGELLQLFSKSTVYLSMLVAQYKIKQQSFRLVIKIKNKQKLLLFLRKWKDSGRQCWVRSLAHEVMILS